MGNIRCKRKQIAINRMLNVYSVKTITELLGKLLHKLQ